METDDEAAKCLHISIVAASPKGLKRLAARMQGKGQRGTACEAENPDGGARKAAGHAQDRYEGHIPFFLTVKTYIASLQHKCSVCLALRLCIEQSKPGDSSDVEPQDFLPPSV